MKRLLLKLVIEDDSGNELNDATIFIAAEPEMSDVGLVNNLIKTLDYSEALEELVK